MKPLFLGLAFCCLLGCSTRNGYGPIMPLSPLGTWRSPNPTVDSLQPVLRWHPIASEGVTNYDIVLYKQYDNAIPGEQVYYREGISTTEHRVEEQLNPNTKYLWSVRGRKQDIVSPWASWHGAAWLVLASEHWSGRFFGFQTPSQ